MYEKSMIWDCIQKNIKLLIFHFPLSNIEYLCFFCFIVLYQTYTRYAKLWVWKKNATVHYCEENQEISSWI